ncbi:MAG: MerR family transcriptional regulator [Epulopiscium sp.]|nr:MerR family transcriptional regulator [Candidatus Epulonipiscium sp.]
MKPKILIGEMARLHNISTQTLRYYDQIGLLKPQYIDEENNYRYYSVDQFALLDSILLLKELGMSLQQIQNYFDDRNTESMMELLQVKQRKIEKEIRLLKQKNKSISNKRSFI